HAAFGSDLVGIALYGSRARGEARPDSDVDLLLIARNLPVQPRARAQILHEGLRGVSTDLNFSVYERTPEEFESYFPSVFLDMGLDGIILYDPEEYLTQKLARIREIIEVAGLYRYRLSPKSLCWNWKNPPRRGWEITWEGYRALA
ncbi:MAG TPA: nucleotidyltransferase domain-containing protein, partial [Anaerolineae bacterium]|nr:nucleotidyltransferase domain-containing protein [Anaerolineae bacterium]